MRKVILYYTCNTHRPDIEAGVRGRLKTMGLPIVSVSLNQEIGFGDVRLKHHGPRGPESLHAQILLGLTRIQSECPGGQVFFCENDVLYHPSHFDFDLPQAEAFWYNENTYKVDYFTGRAVFYYTKQTSGLTADVDLLVEHYKKRLDRIRAEGRFDRRIGFEPGCHPYPRGVDRTGAREWMSEFPNLDIRHDRNATKSKWSLDDFRDKRTARGWQEVKSVPYWGTLDSGLVSQLRV